MIFTLAFKPGVNTNSINHTGHIIEACVRLLTEDGISAADFDVSVLETVDIDLSIPGSANWTFEDRTGTGTDLYNVNDCWILSRKSDPTYKIFFQLVEFTDDGFDTTYQILVSKYPFELESRVAFQVVEGDRYIKIVDDATTLNISVVYKNYRF